MSQRWQVLLVTALGVFIVSLDVTIINIAFPAIQASFPHTSRTSLSWILNAYSIVFAALLVASGRVADLLGRRRVFFWGLHTFTLASLLCGVAPSVFWLIATRVLQACGAAAMIPASLALLLSAFPVSQRATAVGLWGAVAAIAAALGPSMGSALIEWAHWRWAFLINLPIGLGAWAWGRTLLTESQDLENLHRPDYVGVLLAIASVGLLALGVVQGAHWPLYDPRRLLCFAGVGVFFPVLLWRCARHPSPVIDLRLFRVRSFVIANLATLLFAAAFFGALLSSVLYLTWVWGYTSLAAGFAITPTPLLAALVAGPAGRIADRYGHRLIVVPGTLLFALGSFWFALCLGSQAAYQSQWLPGALLVGSGLGMAFPTLASAAAASLPPSRFAVGCALNVTARQFGAVLGVAGFIALLGTPHPGEIAPSFTPGWIFFGLDALAAGGCSVALGRRITPTPAHISPEKRSCSSVESRKDD